MLIVSRHPLLTRKVAPPVFVVAALMGFGVAQAQKPDTVIVKNQVTSVNPARRAFSATFSNSTSSQNSLSDAFGTIPAGTRLVIENESIECNVSPVGTSIEYAYISTTLGTTYLTLQKVSSGAGLDNWAGTFTSKMYADPRNPPTGEDLRFDLQADGSDLTLSCNGSVIGYTIPFTPHP